MGVPCVAVLRDADMANRASRLRSGRRASTSAGSTGCTFSTMYTWALSLLVTGHNITPALHYHFLLLLFCWNTTLCQVPGLWAPVLLPLLVPVPHYYYLRRQCGRAACSGAQLVSGVVSPMVSGMVSRMVSCMVSRRSDDLLENEKPRASCML